MIFRHQKCSGGTGYISGHRKGFRASPRQLHGPTGPRRGQTSPSGVGAPHVGQNKGEGKRGRDKGRGAIRPPPSFSPPSSFRPPPGEYGRGVAELGGAQVGFLLLGAPPWLPLLPSNLYIYIYICVGGGTARTHNKHC